MDDATNTSSLAVEPDAEIAESPFGGARAFAGAPRALVALVWAVVTIRLLLGLLTPGPLVFPLLQVALLAFIAWKALCGAKAAARLFAVLLLVSAATTTYQLATAARVPTVNVIVFGAWVVLLLATAAFILFHPAVRQFYAHRAGTDWGGAR